MQPRSTQGGKNKFPIEEIKNIRASGFNALYNNEE